MRFCWSGGRWRAVHVTSALGGRSPDSTALTAPPPLINRAEALIISAVDPRLPPTKDRGWLLRLRCFRPSLRLTIGVMLFRLMMVLSVPWLAKIFEHDSLCCHSVAEKAGDRCKGLNMLWRPFIPWTGNISLGILARAFVGELIPAFCCRRGKSYRSSMAKSTAVIFHTAIVNAEAWR